MAIQFHTLNVVTVRYQTDAAVQIGFQIPESKKDVFNFEPGQYLTISLTVDDQKVRRAYSICSATHESVVSILVKRVDDGLVSNYLNDTVKVGDKFDVLPPNGHFKLSLDAEQKHCYNFFGAGSGITPLASMISSILENEPESHCHLLYGNRDEENVIFHHKLDRMQLVYNDRFSITYLLSRPKSSNLNWISEVSRVNTKTISDFLNNQKHDTEKIQGYYICGPGQMIENTYNGLIELNIEKDLIHREYFSAPVSDVEASVAVDRPMIDAQVKVILDGKEINLNIDDDTNIIQAIINKDIEPPYSCLSGTCSTCMAKLAEGEVVMDVSIGLEDDEEENGYIFTCQSHPITETVVVNYDDL